MSEPLALQAQAWLARMEASDLTPEQHPELLNLALACHRRMLELGERDRAAAVELAIAGADLLQALQRHSPPGSAVPEWVLVHEEQCCRYGAIWMHDHLQQDPGISPQRLQRGIGLLQRLQELHPEPMAWIANMHSDLQQALDLADADSKKDPSDNDSKSNFLPPSIHSCVWISSNPLQALRELGHWAMGQPTNDMAALLQLIEVASRTRDPELITAAQAWLCSDPPAEPLHSYFELELQQASGASPQVLHELARKTLLGLQSTSAPWDERSWRLLAVLLHDTNDPKIQEKLQSLLRAIAPLEQAHHLGTERSPAATLAKRKLESEDVQRAGIIYADCPPSIRHPYALWADPEAIDASALDHLIQRLAEAKDLQQGFSLIRLGDGEGLFLCGRRPDLGGAISNGSRINERLAAQGQRLEDPEHTHLRRQLAKAVADADWIGIPDLPQCLSGPVDCVSVASGLNLMLSPDEQKQTLPKLIPGGCHVHNYLLQAGAYSRWPFNSVQAVIAPSLPKNLRDKKDLAWLQIPGEARLRSDTFGSDAHYPKVFQQTLSTIDQLINPGDLVLVGAGILGKIYCEAVRRRSGIAVDVGSVIDLCSGHGGTRGEYRMHPWLHHQAERAFEQA